MGSLQERSNSGSIDRDILKLYAQPLKFSGHVLKDTCDINIWFDDETFAKWRDVDGVRILTIMTQDKTNQPISENISDSSGYLSMNNFVLYCKACDIVQDVKTGTVVRIDGKMYQVNSAQKILNDSVWRFRVNSCA